ncbi:MAG: MFS transporter [Candidatus Eisenbacteria bacterium]
MNRTADNLYCRRVNAWCLYDWANSAFATTVMAAFLPIFYAGVAAGHLPGARATAYWGYTTAVSLAVAAILSPLAGAAADHLGRRKRFLLVFALFGALATSLLATVGPGGWRRASLLYMLAHVPFVLSFVHYDSLLPFVARPGDLDRISTRGYAVGYLGGGLLLLLNTAMVLFPSAFLLPSATAGIRASFVTVTIWWLLFTIPLARRIPEPEASAPDGVPTLGAALAASVKRLSRTIREIRRYREAWKFLLAFWVYGDGIGTIIKMAVIYGAEIGIGRDDLIGALLAVQFVGVPFSFLFGRLAGRIGARTGIFLGLAVYAGIAVGAAFLSKPWHFWVLALLVGTVQGGTQALSRSLFASLTPKERSAEWFGFFSVSSRFAGIAGPLLFGLVAQRTGTSRHAILLLVLFFVAGALLLARVRPDRALPPENR